MTAFAKVNFSSGQALNLEVPLDNVVQEPHYLSGSVASGQKIDFTDIKYRVHFSTGGSLPTPSPGPSTLFLPFQLPLLPHYFCLFNFPL